MLPKLQIIANEPDFIVINKPANLLSIPGRDAQAETSVKQILQTQFNEIYTVHRIDKETSGIIIFAKNVEAHKTLNTMFEQKQIYKQYVGICQGKPMQNQGTINVGISEDKLVAGKMRADVKGKDAITHFTLLESFGTYSYMQFIIETGRTHQIRVHCQYNNHSLLADTLYGDGKHFFVSDIKRKFNLSKTELEERPMLARTALHAQELKFTYNDIAYTYTADLPKDMQATLKQLGRWVK
jgi:23S rRNA pseudouridine1911/1915/1917 synthase